MRRDDNVLYYRLFRRHTYIYIYTRKFAGRHDVTNMIHSYLIYKIRPLNFENPYICFCTGDLPIVSRNKQRYGRISFRKFASIYDVSLPLPNRK